MEHITWRALGTSRQEKDRENTPITLMGILPALALLLHLLLQTHQALARPLRQVLVHLLVLELVLPPAHPLLQALIV